MGLESVVNLSEGWEHYRCCTGGEQGQVPAPMLTLIDQGLICRHMVSSFWMCACVSTASDLKCTVRHATTGLVALDVD
ncbi:hypothetical protein CBR_g57539 [Chara braunii]|uniref:Uncharacterized protein n=1 Tax=Chara braunii TaxID=69332 RepID=A0A388MED9_CHABU|nr:hypothetical protein CBR_g57539 [Chara braunii]|eukprot:GBG92859.1 hypothetical protein CBR_g57539 [Chara braunii]